MKDLKLLNTFENFYAVDNDLTIKNHDIQLIEGEEKITQDIVKFLLIERGGNFLFPNYGTNISKIIGSRNTTDVIDELNTEIIYALKYVKEMNKDNTINIKKILSIEITDEVNNYYIIITLLLTNNKTLTIRV